MFYKGRYTGGGESGDTFLMTAALGDEATEISATGEVLEFTYRGPNVTLNAGADGLIIDMNTAPTGSGCTFDVNVNASTILSTKITVDATETSSEDAVTPCVITDRALTDGDVITVDVDAYGSTTGGAGAKLSFVGVIN